MPTVTEETTILALAGILKDRGVAPLFSGSFNLYSGELPPDHSIVFIPRHTWDPIKELLSREQSAPEVRSAEDSQSDIGPLVDEQMDWMSTLLGSVSR